MCNLVLGMDSPSRNPYSTVESRGNRPVGLMPGDVEGVAQQPRGVSRRVVERIEVVIDGLHLRTLGHVEPEPDEHVLDLAPGLRDEVKATDVWRRVAIERVLSFEPRNRDHDRFYTQYRSVRETIFAPHLFGLEHIDVFRDVRSV